MTLPLCIAVEIGFKQVQTAKPVISNLDKLVQHSYTPSGQDKKVLKYTKCFTYYLVYITYCHVHTL